MGNYENLKQSITEVIRTNGNHEITGAVLQSTLLTIISTVGANATFAGVATPATNPGTPDGPVFYLASESGTYTNFGSIELQDGLSVLMWNGSWSSQQIFSTDDEPTAGSDNLVKSGGVQEELALGTVYDVSAKNPTAGVNNDGKFESLSALLGDANLDTLIPTSVRKGGMSIKFVQSSDNKYVQFRLMADEFTTDVTKWAIAEEGVYVDNPEYVYVKTDAEGKILWAIKADGSIYYGAGVPQQVIDYIEEKIADLSLDEYEDIVAFLDGLEEGDKTLQTLLNEKVDKEEGKSLIDAEYASSQSAIENPEFLDVTLDAEDKVLEGIQTDGTKVIGGDLKVLGNMEVSGVSYKVIDNPEFILAILDQSNKIVFGIENDGTPYYGSGISEQTKKAIEVAISPLFSSLNDIKTKIDSRIEVVYRNLDALKAVYAAKKHYDDSSQNHWYLTSSNSNLFCIAHGTDFHSDNIRMKNFMDFVDNVDEINLAIGTGDFVVLPTDDEFNIVYDIKPKKKDFLKVLGNHDVYSDTFTSADVASKLNMDSPYYYKDYMDYNVRIIVLNQYDVPSNITVSSGNLRDLRGHTEHFSQTQIDWFISVLDSAIESNLNVIICMHSPEFEQAPVKNDKKFYQRNWNWASKSSYIDGAIIEDIVNAFKKGIAINKTYTYQNENADIPSVTANHTFGGNGKFICYLVGHLHSDFIGVSNNYEDQLYLIETCTCAVPQIENTRNYGEEVNDLPRIVGTSCEDAFNVYCFDFDKKQIKVVRVGSNINDQMEFRDKEIYTYK